MPPSTDSRTDLVMYLEYFGFDRFPFTIAPDPDFLFPSRGHQEALAHLQYALTGLGGLISLTGEVGTGKTTLCRSFLADLPEGIKTAYIFNPQLSSIELLQSICDDLGIEYGESDSLRNLYRYLNAFLIKQYAAGHKVICVIDEAQSMSADLLEQVRLLTNLETHTEKLMTLILVGQPELQDTLARHDLRQLNQRITARYHLRHLSLADTRDYLNFRIRKAGAEGPLFTDGAVKRLWQVSKGVPRLMNTIADRALLGAYAREEKQVSVSLIKGAEQEILPAAPVPEKRRSVRVNTSTKSTAGGWLRNLMMVSLVAVLAAGGAVVALQPDLLQRWFFPQQNPVAILSQASLGREITGCQAVSMTGYECLWVDWDISSLTSLAPGQVLYQIATVNGDIRWQLEAPLAPDKYNGHALLFWQPPPGFDQNALIKPGERSPVVSWARKQLGGGWDENWEVITPQGQAISSTGEFYDPLLANRVERFQRLNGLLADKILGPQTLYYLQQAGD